MSSMLLMLYVVVEKVVESMHTNIKLGLMPCLIFNHSYHVDLRANALHVELRADALHDELRANALHVELRADALTR